MTGRSPVPKGRQVTGASMGGLAGAMPASHAMARHPRHLGRVEEGFLQLWADGV